VLVEWVVRAVSAGTADTPLAFAYHVRF